MESGFGISAGWIVVGSMSAVNSTPRKPILFAAAAFGLVALGYFAFSSWPALWARDFPVDPAANARLALTHGLSTEDAAWEAIHGAVPDHDRVPRDRASISVDEAGSDAFVVRVTFPAQDDSYGRMFYELTLVRQASTWTVTRLRRCWTGRGLTGWSTGIPS